MKRKIQLFVVVFLALIATTTMLESNNKIKETRNGVYEVYEKIVTKEDINCGDYENALKLLEAYTILTKMDRETTKEEQEKTSAVLNNYRRIASEKCPDSKKWQYVPVNFPDPGIGIKIKKVPTFVYSMYYMPGSLQAKYLSNLPGDQREYAEQWIRENVEVKRMMNSYLKDELKRHEPVERDILLKTIRDLKEIIQKSEKEKIKYQLSEEIFREKQKEYQKEKNQ